ncbi:MAG: hypothetical protein CMI18_14440 [Opitutaceae bacterium]|nr:hypothetical protein [Opitutaceae bacterium]
MVPKGILDLSIRLAADNLLEIQRIQFLVIQQLYLIWEHQECFELMRWTFRVLDLLSIGSVIHEECLTETYYQ